MTVRALDTIREELRRARAEDRVHGAYLLEGPSGSGKQELAIWFARLLLCRAERPDPCDRCAGCTRSRVREEQGRLVSSHADLAIVEPDGVFIRVDQIRALHRQLALVANEGGRRIALLIAAERLRTEAANALLKLLEEPPAGATLMLVAERAEGLPRTVRSRATRLRLLPEGEAEIAAALQEQGLDSEDAWLVAALGGGSATRAGEWAERHLGQAREMLALLRGIGTAEVTDVLDFAERFRGGEARARTELLLDVLGALARRAAESATAEKDRPTLEHWLRHADAAARARRELLRRNLNAQLLVEGLLLDLHASAARS